MLNTSGSQSRRMASSQEYQLVVFSVYHVTEASHKDEVCLVARSTIRVLRND